jgi:multimeric flavodoxin WrbA
MKVVAFCGSARKNGNTAFLLNSVLEIVVGSSYWNIGIGREKGEVAGDEEGINTMKTLGENIGWLLGKVKK